MILSWLINSTAVFLTSKLLSGVEIKNFWTAIWVAAGISLANFILGPVLKFLTFPITLLTFGLFAIIVNTVLVMLVDKFIDNFKIKNFGWALVFTMILSVISTVLMSVFN